MNVLSAIQYIHEASDEALYGLSDYSQVLDVAQRLTEVATRAQAVIRTSSDTTPSRLSETITIKRDRSVKFHAQIVSVTPWLWSFASRVEGEGTRKRRVWKHPNEIIQMKRSRTFDKRLEDIIQIEGTKKPTNEQRLFRGLAQRSLALQYESQRKRDGKPSRIDEILLALTIDDKAERKKALNQRRGGHIKEFVETHICNDSHVWLTRRSTIIGLKYLAMEQILAANNPEIKTSGLSAIASLAGEAFRILPLSDISRYTAFCASDKFKIYMVNHNDETENEVHILLHVIDVLSHWYDGLQEYYDRRTSYGDYGTQLQATKRFRISSQRQDTVDERFRSSQAVEVEQSQLPYNLDSSLESASGIEDGSHITLQQESNASSPDQVASISIIQTSQTDISVNQQSSNNEQFPLFEPSTHFLHSNSTSEQSLESISRQSDVPRFPQSQLANNNSDTSVNQGVSLFAMRDSQTSLHVNQQVPYSRDRQSSNTFQLAVVPNTAIQSHPNLSSKEST